MLLGLLAGINMGWPDAYATASSDTKRWRRRRPQPGKSVGRQRHGAACPAEWPSGEGAALLLQRHLDAVDDDHGAWRVRYYFDGRSDALGGQGARLALVGRERAQAFHVLVAKRRRREVFLRVSVACGRKCVVSFSVIVTASRLRGLTV